MSSPKAVLISDIHYNLSTLPIADLALRHAVDKANQLNVPLIVAGDLHDTKANLRGECIKAMIETFKCSSEAYILVGNHCRVNERSQEHSLNFLEPYASVVSHMAFLPTKGLYLIAYQHDPDQMRRLLSQIPLGSTIIMHQGVESASMGDYIQDKSAISKEDIADFRVISGHYHTRQDIKCGRPRKGAIGLLSYIGNPYTLTYGEANDPEKGFQILNSNGTLEFVPTNLRRHIVIEMAWSDTVNNFMPTSEHPGKINAQDLVWIKVTGPKDKLQGDTRGRMKKSWQLEQSFRLDLIPLETETKAPEVNRVLTKPELLDSLVNSLTNTPDDQKERLKALWRSL